MFEPSHGLSSNAMDESALLEVYKQSIPPEFDIDFIELQKSMRIQWDKALHSSRLRASLARNAMQGHYSRCMLEDAVMSLAEAHGLKVGIFNSSGGSSHVKISTNDAVITFHTLGDKEEGLSRFAEYKKALARNNPLFLELLSNGTSKSLCFQGRLFIDDDIGAPEIPAPGYFNDSRLYFTICVPRVFHHRNDILLIAPNRLYSNSIIEFNYLEIRDPSLTSTMVNLLNDNVMVSKPLSLKKDDANDIRPKRIDTDTEERDKGT